MTSVILSILFSSLVLKRPKVIIIKVLVVSACQFIFNWLIIKDQPVDCVFRNQRGKLIIYVCKHN